MQGTVDSGRADDAEPVVLIVDDEPRVAEAFSLWLDDAYEVRTATDGEVGLAELERGVDAVLLDRRMPGLSGDEVLDRIRERGYDCRVALVTAVDPDFDIVEMDVDDYVTKPVDGEELNAVVERLLALQEFDRDLCEFAALSRKLSALEAEKPRKELSRNDDYVNLVERRDRLKREVEDRLDELSPGRLRTLFDALPGTSG